MTTPLLYTGHLAPVSPTAEVAAVEATVTVSDRSSAIVDDFLVFGLMAVFDA